MCTATVLLTKGAKSETATTTATAKASTVTATTGHRRCVEIDTSFHSIVTANQHHGQDDNIARTNAETFSAARTAMTTRTTTNVGHSPSSTSLPSSLPPPSTTRTTRKYARVKSILFMSSASAVHLGAFEIARGATMALFTSQRTGFSSNPSASPISTVCMTPFSLALLWLYTKTLDRYGPHKSLCLSTLAFAVLLVVCGWILFVIDPHLSPTQQDEEVGTSINNEEEDYKNLSPSFQTTWKRLAQTTIFVLHVAGSAFVQLLYTQHWSFLGSVVAVDDGGDGNSKRSTATKAAGSSRSSSSSATMWFAPIAGLGSVASTVIGLCMPMLVDKFGLIGLLSVASFVLLLSGVCADQAYRIALRNGFEPGHFNNSTSNSKNTTCSDINNDKNSHHQDSLVQASFKLFTRVPILASLCLEVLACQSVSSIIHFLFMLKVQQSIPDDSHRASWTGRCYAWINACSGILQFVVLPLLMRVGGDDSETNSKSSIEGEKCNNGSNVIIDDDATSRQQRRLWLIMPVTMMICATLLIYYNHENEESLSLVTATFGLYKVLEYSVRGVAMETLYASLDYESRFLGKELIGMVVDRVGRSSTAVVLSCITNIFGLSPLLDKAFVQALSVSSLLWLVASFPLANYCQCQFGMSRSPSRRHGKAIKPHHD
jgi:ATP/ADP translocase